MKKFKFFLSAVLLLSFGIFADAQTRHTVTFHYNYEGAPAAPESFIKQTGTDGRIGAFPVEQTLPGVGSRPGYGFVGWYKNREGTGEKVRQGTVFNANTNLYAKWEIVPSLHGEYSDYFLMGAFQTYRFNPSNQVDVARKALIDRHYNILCPSNDFKLADMIGMVGTDADNAGITKMRNNFVAERNRIMNDASLSNAQKAAALQRANEQIYLSPGTNVQNVLNELRAWNLANPDNPKFTRFHVVVWHGGQQPGAFFTNGFAPLPNNQADYDAALLLKQDLTDSSQDGAPATRETMKARLDNLMRLLMEKYAPYADLIVSWDIINEPVDDFTGQLRNTTDSNSQLGQWGFIWHDAHPALDANGNRLFSHRETAGMPTDERWKIINDQARLYDESEWLRWAMESAAKWSEHFGVDWGLYVTDYMDSNKLYTKLQPTIDIMQWIRDDVDLRGRPFGHGMQGRLAWAYPTIDMLRKQLDDVLAVVDQIGIMEADIRSDFEPNPFFNPNMPTRPVYENDRPQWNANDLNSGSGSFANPPFNTLMNAFDTHNSPVRRIPEWGAGSGMDGGAANNPSFPSERYNTPADNLAISETLMKNQADFAADFMDLLIERKNRISLFQWDGTSDRFTFNSNKGAHLWVSGIQGYEQGQFFEKYSFFAVIGAPARDKLKQAINAGPSVSEASKFTRASWEVYINTLREAQTLLSKRIYTLEGVNDVKDATSALYKAANALVIR